MTTLEAIEFQRKAITRIREIELERLKRENLSLRATLALLKFYQLYNAQLKFNRGKIYVLKEDMT